MELYTGTWQCLHKAQALGHWCKHVYSHLFQWLPMGGTQGQGMHNAVQPSEIVGPIHSFKPESLRTHLLTVPPSPSMLQNGVTQNKCLWKVFNGLLCVSMG